MTMPEPAAINTAKVLEAVITVAVVVAVITAVAEEEEITAEVMVAVIITEISKKDIDHKQIFKIPGVINYIRDFYLRLLFLKMVRLKQV